MDREALIARAEQVLDDKPGWHLPPVLEELVRDLLSQLRAVPQEPGWRDVRMKILALVDEWDACEREYTEVAALCAAIRVLILDPPAPPQAQETTPEKQEP